MPALTISIQHSTGSLSQDNQAKKRNKRYTNLKGRSKIYLYANVIILCTENTEDYQKTVRINKFSKILVYKINMKKFVTFLYAYNGLFEKEIKKIIPF